MLKKGFDVGYFCIFIVFSYIAYAERAPKLEPIYDAGNMRFLEYKVTNVLQCNITNIGATDSEKNYSMKWLKNDQRMEPSKEVPPHYMFEKYKLIIKRTREEDIANYTCVLALASNEKSGYLARADIPTVGIPSVKILSQGTFIEGQKISLECVVTGNPTPTVEWRIGNKTIEKNTERVKLEGKKIPNTILLIDEAQMSDRGEYFCTAHNIANTFNINTTEATTFVRVKDKLAALWPFIGICAEVIVLCAIIFIYERKRNKAELDESDTDQSPEQKNTPDHGKESVRQRK